MAVALTQFRSPGRRTLAACALTLLLSCAPHSRSQDKLSLPDVQGPPGATVNLPLTLTTASRTLSGLEWRLSVPAGVTFGVSSVLPGKTLTCNLEHCILYGKQLPIASGRIGVIAITLPDDLKAPVRVSLDGVMGATGDGQAREVAGASATISLGPTPCPPPASHPHAAAPAAVSLLGNATPRQPDAGDGKSVELGMKFVSDVEAVVTGVRFYKGKSNTGRHLGSLWSNDGKQLASVEFKNESGSGWQTARFEHPVPIAPGETYTASYFCPKGNYAADPGFFAAAVDRPPLHAPANAGVFTYSPTPAFPQSSFRSYNYWVEPIITTK